MEMVRDVIFGEKVSLLNMVLLCGSEVLCTDIWFVIL